ncbi:MAG TPA: hypothetical protein VFA66_06275 [Gaiellaceae bacterium]|nr:hypothetical protein [Gaiellaceae bacterium]
MSAAVAAARSGSRTVAVLGAVAIAVSAIAYTAAEPTQLRTAVTLGAVLLAAAIGLSRPEPLLYVVVVWLVALGFVRRVLTLVVASHGSDPLLLVEPAAVALLLLVTASRVQPRRTALSLSVGAMSVIIAASALNPAQGSLKVGAAGLLFLLVPTAGFWLGRTLCTDVVFGRVLKLVAAVSIPVAAYGLVQTFVSFPRWDRIWIQSVQEVYQALNVGTAVRPFSSLPSSAEYAHLVAIGAAIWLAFGIRTLRLPFTAAAVGLLGAALVLASSRLVVFLTAAAIIAMVVARLRIPAGVAAGLVLGAILATSAVVGRVAPDYYAPGAASDLIAHQTEGLANPLDPSSSTFLIHLSLVTDGLHSAVSHPAGFGAGAVSLAAGKFGGTGLQTEADPSNLAVAAGFPGFAIYLVLATIAFVRAYALARARRDALSLGALAIITIVFLQWFNGGQYGIALLLWLTLGWVDRASARGAEPEAAAGGATR